MKTIAVRYGLMMLAGFIIFFLFMHLLGLSTNFHLRVFNGVIHLGVIYLAIREFTSTSGTPRSNYLDEVAVGMYTSFFGVVGFTIFMTLFLSFNPYFLSEVQAAAPNIGEYLTPFTTSLYIFVEGIVVSLIGSYVIARVVDSFRVRS